MTAVLPLAIVRVITVTQCTLKKLARPLLLCECTHVEASAHEMITAAIAKKEVNLKFFELKKEI